MSNCHHVHSKEEKKGENRETLRPRLLVSRCLGFEACRYNGEMISCELVQELEGFVDMITVCPEMELGLGVPRSPVRVVQGKEGLLLVQPETKKEMSQEMKAFTRRFLDELPPLDGVLLKARSPSCGLWDTKIFSGERAAPVLRRGAGLFGEEVLKRFGNLPVEDELRVKNTATREQFLTKLFTLAGSGRQDSLEH